MDMKKCTKCGGEKQTSEFFERSRGGLHPWCKQCKAAYYRDRLAASPLGVARAQRRERKLALAAQGLRRCSKCNGEMSTTEFYKRSDRAGGLSTWCRKCRSLYERLRKADFPGGRDASTQRRIALRIAAVERLYSYHGACECSGCPVIDKSQLSIDHRAGNGKEERARIGLRGIYARVVEMDDPTMDYGLLCIRCNTSKGRGERCALTQDEHRSASHASPARRCGGTRIIPCQPIPGPFTWPDVFTSPEPTHVRSE